MVTSYQSRNILVASNSSNDAALVVDLLASEFENVSTSTNPDKAIEEFSEQRPDILVLAFSHLDVSERYYLSLYRRCEDIHRKPHRTIALCTKEEVNRAYMSCREGLFDDYVLFWPITQDTPRLRMATHHALRALDVQNVGGPTLADFAVQARRLAELEALLEQRMAQGGQHIEETSQAIGQAELEIGASLDGFSERLAQGAIPDAHASTLKKEVHRLKQEDVRRSMANASNAIRPMKQWADDLKKECVPHQESARALNVMAESLPPPLLVVDDDAFVRKVIGKVLETANYRPIFAANGIEALKLLSEERPALILMDFEMPGMNGIEVTFKLKADPTFRDIPIVMLTGHSEKEVSTACAQAGANGFIVKPCTRDKLLEKVSEVLGTQKATGG